VGGFMMVAVGRALSGSPREPDRVRATEAKSALAHQRTGAHKNAARVRFIEDPELLADVGGVGALLRFKIKAKAARPGEHGGRASTRPRSAPEE